MLIQSLTKDQELDQRNEVIADLFGTGTDVRKAVKKMTDLEKSNKIITIENHVEFFFRISQENPEKYSFRVETARFRVEQLYPQLLELLKS